MANNINFRQRVATLPRQQALAIWFVASVTIAGGWFLAQQKNLINLFVIGLVAGLVAGLVYWQIGSRMVVSSADVARSSAGSARGVFLGVIAMGVLVAAVSSAGLSLDSLMIPFVGIIGTFLLVLGVPVIVYGKR